VDYCTHETVYISHKGVKDYLVAKHKYTNAEAVEKAKTFGLVMRP